MDELVLTDSMTRIITQMIGDELLNPTFEMTRQFLRILEVEYDDRIPKIIKIEIDEKEKQVIAYVLVKNEDFYLEFSFNIQNAIEIKFIDTAPLIKIDFYLTSEEHTLKQLLDLTTIKPSRVLIKGDSFSNGKFQHTNNSVVFESYTEPGRLENKLNFLLDILEKDSNGIKELIKQTNCNNLFITIVFHIGNGIFTGIYLDNEIINRLSKLGLQLTFDIYTTGNKFAEY